MIKDVIIQMADSYELSNVGKTDLALKPNISRLLA